MRELGVWRSWLAHLVWDQRVLCSSHSTPTKEQLIFNCSFFCLTLMPGDIYGAVPSVKTAKLRTEGIKSAVSSVKTAILRTEFQL